MHCSVLLITGLLFIDAGPTQLIDNAISQRWQQDDVRPSARSDDYEFFRRLSLDLRGVIPTSREVRTFVADSDPRKREKQIDRWLTSKDTARYWAYLWAEELIGKNFDLDEIKLGGRFGGVKWLLGCLQQNMPFDRFVTKMLAPKDIPSKDPSASILAYILWSTGKGTEVGVRSARIFLGTQMDCAECHDHPFDSWTQKEYKSMAAFFVPSRLIVEEIGDNEVLTGIADDALDPRDPRDPREPMDEDRDQSRRRVVPQFRGTGEGPRPREPFRNASPGCWSRIRSFPKRPSTGTGVC